MNEFNKHNSNVKHFLWTYNSLCLKKYGILELTYLSNNTHIAKFCKYLLVMPVAKCTESSSPLS